MALTEVKRGRVSKVAGSYPDNADLRIMFSQNYGLITRCLGLSPVPDFRWTV